MAALPDVVYPVREGDNPELRYSLRSLANIPHGRVWIAGGWPSWVRGVGKLPRNQTEGRQAARLNLELALATPEVSDPFILMCDDFYAMRPMEAVPTLHCGTLSDRIKCDLAGLPFRRVMVETLDYIRDELGIDDPLCYDLHVPMLIGKQAMRDTLDAIGTRRLLYQTVYGARQNLGGTFHVNAKIPDGPGEPDALFLSSNGRIWAGPLGDRVRSMFPEPCEYER